MTKINNLNISLDMGTIPPLNKLRGKLHTMGIMLDYGVIPPKNFFRGRINVLGIGLTNAEPSVIEYQFN